MLFEQILLSGDSFQAISKHADHFLKSTNFWELSFFKYGDY
jgi:hypothetical protein